MPRKFIIHKHPDSVKEGGEVKLQVLNADLGASPDDYWFDWMPDGDERNPATIKPTRLVDHGSPRSEDKWTEDWSEVFWDTLEAGAGSHEVFVEVFAKKKNGQKSKTLFARGSVAVHVAPQIIQDGNSMQIRMERTASSETQDQSLWQAIRASTKRIGWEEYDRFLDDTISLNTIKKLEDKKVTNLARFTFPGSKGYAAVKAATELFLMDRVGVIKSGAVAALDEDEESADLGFDYEPNKLLGRYKKYLAAPPLGGTPQKGKDAKTLPYIDIIKMKLDLGRGPSEPAFANELLERRLRRPLFIELIWSYWHEMGMLVQSMNAISMRFQNRRMGPGPDPLSDLDLDPLRPLNSILWAYIQDEQHRLSLAQRAYEYDHHYGLRLEGRAVPQLQAADSRSRFMESFHQLLFTCGVFFKEDDDTMVKSDGFPVLQALKDVHVLLTEGQHNQYGDLPWTARVEMLVQQWILSRSQLREYLPGRAMVAYPEPWQDRVDSMKRMFGWTEVSSIHFRELAVFGEQILLSIRYSPWSTIHDASHAKNWVRYWRAEIQAYKHAYRVATGIDLASDARLVTPVVPVLPGRPDLTSPMLAPARSRMSVNGRMTQVQFRAGRR